ncbi:MAG: phosphoribosyltransferase [Planctomycetes bacterium]|nr:phosphoribosyltransferase [Planctomycetota bacterium]
MAFPGSSPEERATARPPPRNPESADSTARAEQEWRPPYQSELAIGAIAEDGAVHLNAFAAALAEADEAWIEAEKERQLAEIARRREMIRRVRPAARPAGRSVIVVDDGIATGATMIAALHTVRAERLRELVVAVPVAPPDRVAAIRPLCDRLVCLHERDDFQAVGQCYDSFPQVADDRVLDLLRAAARPLAAAPVP